MAKGLQFRNNPDSEREAPPVRSNGIRRLTSGKTLITHHFVNFKERGHKLTVEERAERRADNKTMKLSRQLHRRRKPHGR